MATTYTHSHTLNPGEAMVLPPGATILFTTDNDGLETVCAELPTEELECFVAVLAGYSTDETDYGYWEAEQQIAGPGQEIIGYELDGVRTLFDNPITSIDNGAFDTSIGCMDMEALGVALQDSLPAIFDYAVSFKTDGGDIQNCLSHILIQTVPSIANKLKLVVRSSTSSLIPLQENQVIGLFPFYTYAELEAQSYTHLPESPCTPEV